MDKETLRLIGSICELVFDYVNAKQADLGLQEHIKDSMHNYYKELQDEIERLHNAADEDDDVAIKEAVEPEETLDDYLDNLDIQAMHDDLSRILKTTIMVEGYNDKAKFHDNKKPVNCICKRAIKKTGTSRN